MKNIQTAFIVATFGLVLALPQAEASPILRAGFDVGATTYNLSGATTGSVTATDGDATLINGRVDRKSVV